MYMYELIFYYSSLYIKILSNFKKNLIVEKQLIEIVDLFILQL